MRTIYKYPCPVIAGYFQIEMPQGARILSVQLQHQGQFDKSVLWAEVNTDMPMESRVFIWVGTGQEISNSDKGRYRDYIGTVQFYEGSLVYHLFEDRESARAIPL